MNQGAVYPEIVGYKSRGETVPAPEFPELCPSCGASITEVGPMYAEYACGGKYEPKPQIQNHTDYFWGRCPK